MSNIHGLWDVISKTYFILDKKQRKTSIVIFFLTLISAVFEMLGVSMVVPFVQAMLMPETLLKYDFIQKLLSFLKLSNNMLITLMGIGLVSIYLIKNLYLMLFSYIKAKFWNGVEQQISVKMFKSYLNRPYIFHVNTNSSILMRGTGYDVTGVCGVLNQLFRIMAEVITIVIIGVYVFFSDFVLAFSIIGLASISFSIVVLFFKKPLKKQGINSQTYASLISQYLYQAFSGVKEIFVMQRKEYFLSKYEETYKKKANATSIQQFAGECPTYVIESICVSGLIGIVCYRGATGTNLNEILPQLAAFVVAAVRILPSVARISTSFNQVIYWKPALDVTFDNFKEVKEYEQKNETVNVKANQDEVHSNFSNQISVSHINWKYDDKYILKDLTMEIERGESIALIGSSGAGKTTLVDIMLGLLKPEIGLIKVDGVDISKIPNQWACMIGYVPQSVFLIDDTIRKNIAFGIFDEEIDNTKIWHALEQAQLKEFVEQLPEGLETIVGERGIKFSGGQRQRVAIARALYTNPEILVLDEATSALDNETEEAVMEAIELLQGRKTLIIVAHRLSTIRKCDKIYEVANGKIVERRKEQVLNGNGENRFA